MAAKASLTQESVERCLLRRDSENQQVYFSNPQTGKSYFFAPRVSNLLTENYAEITYDNGPIFLDQLSENTEANLTVEKETIVKVVVTSPRLQKSLFDGYLETFAIFTQQKFPTYVLQQEYWQDPQKRLAAQIISEKFSGIRKVASSGGNGFWTALGVAFFEHLALSVVGKGDVLYFQELLQKFGIQDSDKIFAYLEEVQTAKSNPDCLPGEIVDSWHDKVSFQIELTKTLKTVTLEYIKSHPEPDSVAFLESGIIGIENELDSDQETSETAIAFIASALPIKLVVHTLDPSYHRKSYSSASAHPKQAYIHLLKQRDAYCIVYTESWINVEGYNLLAGKRLKKEVLEVNTMHNLYYEEKLHRTIHFGSREMYTDIVTTLGRQVELMGVAEDFIAATFSTLKRRGLFNKNFFDKELLPDIYALKSSYNAMLAQIDALPPEAKEAANPLRAFEDLGVFKELPVLKRCDLCNSDLSDVELKCGHGICKGCFLKKVAKLRVQQGSIMNPLGEPTKALVCLILDCQDLEPIPKNALRELLGDQFDTYLEDAENEHKKRMCIRCSKVYELSRYSLSSCKCKLCVYCVLELIKANSSTCLCGTRFDELSVADATSRMETCNQCNRTLRLGRDFTTVRCPEHILCISCLQKAIIHSREPEPRCPVDFRCFTEEEIKLAKENFVRICDLGCERLLGASNALDLPCGCHYCKECAFMRAITTGTFHCYCCNQPLPQRLTFMLVRKHREKMFQKKLVCDASANARSTYMAMKCEICSMLIGPAQRFELACYHAFHRDCISEYLKDFISRLVKNEITCPIHFCKSAIAPALLQRAAHPRDFEKYSRLLLKLNTQFINCPACTGPMYKGEIELYPSSHVSCAYCGTHFCEMCLQKWKEPHDPKRCRFECIENGIVILKDSFPPGEDYKIAQCPRCKTPSLKDDSCDHITCPECKVQWCFRCSCLRRPTIEHSLAWHRPQCCFYAKSDGSEKQEKNCPECQSLGRFCNPPPDLKVPGRFDIDEY